MIWGEWGSCTWSGDGQTQTSQLRGPRPGSRKLDPCVLCQCWGLSLIYKGALGDARIYIWEGLKDIATYLESISLDAI